MYYFEYQPFLGIEKGQILFKPNNILVSLRCDFDEIKKRYVAPTPVQESMKLQLAQLTGVTVERYLDIDETCLASAAFRHYAHGLEYYVRKRSLRYPGFSEMLSPAKHPIQKPTMALSGPRSPDNIYLGLALHMCDYVDFVNELTHIDVSSTSVDYLDDLIQLVELSGISYLQLRDILSALTKQSRSFEYEDLIASHLFHIERYIHDWKNGTWDSYRPWKS